MKPVVHKLLAGVSLALRYFVLVVRKDEVFATGMDVEGLAQMLESHRRALDMPARPAGAPWTVPCGFAGFRSLPKREVQRICLALVHFHPRPGLHVLKIPL